MVAPAKSSWMSGAWMVHVFFTKAPEEASSNTKLPWKATRSALGPSSAAPPDTPSNTRPSKTTGLPYTSAPGCVSMELDAHLSAPVASSRAMTYGPPQLLVQPDRDAWETAAYTVPASTASDELMSPPCGAWTFQTRAPVSALMAYTQP